MGHWGWQWYAAKAGMLQYDTTRTELQEGDIVVIPEEICAQQIRPEHRARLREINRITVTPSLLEYLRTMSSEQGGLGFYSFGLPRILPYRVSTAPHVFGVFQVQAEQGS